MSTKSAERQLSEILEELESIREAAASLERLRGVLVTRYRNHPNAQNVAFACHHCAQVYMTEFDRKALALLNMAWPANYSEEEADHAEGR
jgi:hypothetical protein